MFYRLVTCNIGLQVSHEGIQDFSAFLHFPFAVIGLDPQIYLTVLSIPNNTLLSKPEHIIAHGQHTTINEKKRLMRRSPELPIQLKTDRPRSTS